MSRLRTAAGVVKRLAVMELRLYAALVRWCLRRRDVPAGAEPWGYAALVTPVLWLWVFGSATELVVFHLVIPWEGLRLIVDIVSAWGLLWMLGMLAAYRIRPHLLLPRELRIRNSVHHDIVVPRGAVAAASVREADLPSAMFALHVMSDEQGTHLSLGVSGRTNVVVRLQPGTTLRTAKGVVHADTVRFWVDDPRRCVARLNEHDVVSSEASCQREVEAS